MASRFHTALSLQPAPVEVQIDRVGIVFFSQRPGIGTQNLNSCTVVLIRSPFAAIMAHIAPNTPAASLAGIPGEQHALSVLHQALNLVSQYSKHFPIGSTSCVISASPDHGASVFLPEQRNMLAQSLQQYNLPVAVSTYQIPHTGPAGHIVYLEKKNHVTTLYIADQPRCQW